MTVKTVGCTLCGERVPKSEIISHGCSLRYAAWKKPFAPDKTSVAFVGYSPPVPVSASQIKYIYKDPGSLLANTGLKWRNSLHAAFMSKPRLRDKFPPLGDYLTRDDAVMVKEPFLRAIHNSGFEWVDCVEFPIVTMRVRRLLGDPEFVESFGRRLGSKGYQLAIFVSDQQTALENVFRKEMIRMGMKPKSVVLPGNLWYMSPAAAGEVIGAALESI